MIVKNNNQPNTIQEFDVMLCWLHQQPAKPNTKYIMMHTSNLQKARITKVRYKVDIDTYQRIENDAELIMNTIARVTLQCANKVMLDAYRNNRITGSIVLVDTATNETVAGGMVV